MIKRVLITGGTGFVGSNLIKFIKNNYGCINVGRSKSNLCENIYWNLQTPLNYNVNKEIDVIIHIASVVGNNNTSKSDYLDVNLKSTLHLLNYCIDNNIKKFIYISTGGVYGYNGEKFNESNDCNPLDIYSMSKFFSEKLCDLYKDKVSIIILRLFFPYGNGQEGRLFSNLVHDVINEKEIILNQKGLPNINPIHVSDIVKIIKKVMEKDCSGIFNLCGDECISIEELCNKIALHAHVKNPKFIYRDNHVSNLIGNNEKICRLLNYKLNVNLDNGIDMYLKSLRL